MIRPSRICSIEYINGLLDHGLLLGLGDDDHTQYLLADGTRELTADWDVGAYALTVDGLTSTGNIVVSNNGVFQVQGGANPTTPPTGEGVEIIYDSDLAAPEAGTGLVSILAYDRTGSAYKDLDIRGRTLYFRIGATDKFHITTGGDAYFAADVTTGADAYITDNLGIGTTTLTERLNLTDTTSDAATKMQTGVTGIALPSLPGSASEGTITDKGYPWSNPTNITADDLNFADCEVDDDTSDDLRAYNFGFDTGEFTEVPADATIVGIVVSISRKASDGEAVRDYSIKLVDADGNVVGDNKADTVTNWPTSQTAVSYGGASDMWGTSLTAADVRDSDFGVDIEIETESEGATEFGYVYWVKIQVYYTRVTYFTAGIDETDLSYKISYNSALGTTDRFVIDPAGDIGIGKTPTVKLDVEGDIAVRSQKELRFYDNGNYVGFEAPALSADQIWVLPAADGVVGQVLKTDGAGSLGWDDNASEKSWSFTSPSGSSGGFFYGGYYDFAATDNDFNPSVNWGTANSSYAAHFFVVCAAGGAGGTDTVIRITGTSITDAAVRTATDTEDITIDDAGAAGAYYETSKKWIGQVAVAKQSGPDLLCNYGWAKYWDNNNTDFTIKAFEAVWLAGANDSGIDIQIVHHKTTGWTYNVGSTPNFPTLATLQTDHVTEYEAVNGENGAWKRANLDTDVSGSGGEGVLFCVVTTANKAFELGNLMLRIVPQ